MKTPESNLSAFIRSRSPRQFSRTLSRQLKPIPEPSYTPEVVRRAAGEKVGVNNVAERNKDTAERKMLSAGLIKQAIISQAGCGFVHS